MKPKGKLIALLTIFTAIGLVTATGAFTSVSAARTVTVDVAGDSAALLALSANSTANGQYVNEDGGPNGELEIDFSASNLGSAQGLNPNANTTFGSVFDITNNGNQPVELTLSASGTNSDSILLFKGNNSANTDFGTLGTGETVSVGILIDTSDGLGSIIGQSDDFTVSIEIEANAVQ